MICAGTVEAGVSLAGKLWKVEDFLNMNLTTKRSKEIRSLDQYNFIF